MTTDTTTRPTPAASATSAAATMPVATTAPAVVPALPSVHVRAVVTWLAIFPLVAIGMMLIAPFSESWHPVLRALVLTAVVVPLAIYVVVPRLLRGYGALRRRAPRSGVRP